MTIKKFGQTSLDELTWRYTRARQEVLVNPLSWVIEFAQENLKKLPDRGERFTYGWKDYADGMVVFSMPPIWRSASELASISDLEYAPDKKEMVTIQRELRNGINRLLGQADFRSWHIPKLSPSVTLVRLKTGRVIRSYGSKAIRDRFFMAITDILQSKGEYIRKCPVCGRLFEVIKRKAYCSSRCSQKLRTRRYRETHKERLRKKRREKYVGKMKSKWRGVNVKTRRVR